jgi:hypothetical protein
MGPYGDAGRRYVNWCAQMAVGQNVGIPWIMCQQSNAPQPMVSISALFSLFRFGSVAYVNTISYSDLALKISVVCCPSD